MSGSNTERYSLLNILVVEDNEVNQKVTMAMLQHFNIAADLAVNGQEAIDMAAKKKYDLILMDCQMPVKNGFEATRHIRGLSQEQQADFKTHADTIVVAMTANVLPDDIDECEKCGMNDFIAKPIEISVLGVTLKKWFA